MTRTVKEMKDKGYLQKSSSEEDGRVTYLTITEQGKKLSQTFNEQFFRTACADARRYFRRGRGMHHSHHSGALRRHGRKEGHPCLLSAAIYAGAAF